MSGKFASGKYALGLCDRCGFRCKLTTLKALTINDSLTNLLVCSECWEADHPQWKVGKYPVYDPQALRNPRPDPALAASRALSGEPVNSLMIDGAPMLLDGSPVRVT